MQPPPFLLGVTILFWGWQSQLFIIALFMASVLESIHWIKWRVVLEDKDFNRLADFNTVLLVGSIFYLFSQRGVHGLFTFLNWLPILLFPLFTAQCYSSQGTIRLSSLLVSLRKIEGKKGIPISKRLDVSYPYLLICLLSTSVQKTVWFFPGVSMLIAWGLWTMRPQRYSLKIWLLSLSCVIALAFVGQLGLHRLQTEIEAWVVHWLQGRYRDPYRQETAIGEVGQLKQSEKIILRVASQQALLLQEAVYDSYFQTVWRAKQAKFQSIATQDNLTWLFSTPTAQHPESVQIARYIEYEQSLLASPSGTFLVDNLPVEALQRNRLGTVKINQNPSLITYTAYFEPHLAVLPTPQDLLLPANEKALFQRLANDLGLLTQTPTTVVQTLSQFFNRHFHYSLDLGNSSNHSTALADFLYQRRAGHCEYFATTTVLLLRAAGIPARYAVGYAVEEFSPLENLYLVRERHAHAWALAYINGYWQTVDTTPTTWFAQEAEQAPWWRSLYDISAWLNYKFMQWQQSRTHSLHLELIGLAFPFTFILVWRFTKKKKIKYSQQREGTILIDDRYPFYQVVHRLHTAGYTRATGETLANWLAQLPLSVAMKAEIQTMLALHQRQRFDPVGLSEQEIVILHNRVNHWLAIF